MQLSGSRRQFVLRSLDKFLITAIEEAGNFPAYQDAWRNGHDRASAFRLLNAFSRDEHRARSALAHLDPVRHALKRSDLEGVSAQRVQHFVEVKSAGFSYHGSDPICEDGSRGSRIPRIPNLA